MKQVICLFMGILTYLFSLGCSRESTDQVVYTNKQGEQSTDITKQDGKVSYQVLGGKSIPAKAKQLHEQGREKGAAGDYVAAIRLLNEAAALAPDWAYPSYDLAFTYLLKGNHTEALEKYKEVERLEPRGFFTAKTAVWALEREEKGIFPKGTYSAYVSLEWLDSEKKKMMVSQLTTSVPTFAPAWKEQAFLSTNEEEKLQCIEKGLALEPDGETYGILMLNKASVIYQKGQKAEAIAMVEKLKTDPTSTLATKALAQELLKSFKK
jgi:tetratricopeptide (TPR) repeat protein